MKQSLHFYSETNSKIDTFVTSFFGTNRFTAHKLLYDFSRFFYLYKIGTMSITKYGVLVLRTMSKFYFVQVWFASQKMKWRIVWTDRKVFHPHNTKKKIASFSYRSNIHPSIGIIRNETKKWNKKKDHDDQIISFYKAAQRPSDTTTTTMKEKWTKRKREKKTHTHITIRTQQQNEVNSIKENVVKLIFGSNTKTNEDELVRHGALTLYLGSIITQAHTIPAYTLIDPMIVINVVDGIECLF